MFRKSISSSLFVPSLDHIGLSALVTFTGFTILNAYQEGIDPIVDQDHSKDCCTTNMLFTNYNDDHNGGGSSLSQQHAQQQQQQQQHHFTLTPQQCRRMEKEGFLIIDGFLSPNELRRASKSTRYMERQGLFGASPNEKEEDEKKNLDDHDTNEENTTTSTRLVQGKEISQFGQQQKQQQQEQRVRTDRVCFISSKSSHTHQNSGDDFDETKKKDDDDDDEDDKMNGIYHVRRLLRGIAHEVVTSDFQGFQQESSSSSSSSSSSCDSTSSTTTIEKSNDNPSRSSSHNNPNNVYLSQNSWIGVPMSMQVSLYNSLKQPESQPQQNALDSPVPQREDVAGAYYHPHRDGCTDSFLELGLLGWLRSRYLRRRYLTCIVYLNETDGEQENSKSDHVDDDGSGDAEALQNGVWTKEDGGYLRLFIGADQSDDTGESIVAAATTRKNVEATETEKVVCVQPRIVDIEPKGGRLVIFSSEHILHAVLPSFRRRIACTMWLTLNDE